MTFTGGSGAGFESSPQDPSMQTYMARDLEPGKVVEFTVAGTGNFPREDQGAQGGQGDNGAQADQGPGSGPGGGIGTPINTPDPLSRFKWWILAALALLLAAAAGLLLRKPAVAGVPAGAAVPTGEVAPVVHRALSTPLASATHPTHATHSAALLSVLKEELFALESEKIAGTLSPGEYAEQKAALETVLKRALKKS